jgi:hypothetical protein
MAGFYGEVYETVIEDDIPEVSNTEAAKAVIGAIVGEAESIVGSSLEWYGIGYMMVGLALKTTGEAIREHGFRMKRKHYTTLETWRNQA